MATARWGLRLRAAACANKMHQPCKIQCGTDSALAPDALAALVGGLRGIAPILGRRR